MNEKSEKSYGVAVALSGVFGLFGIHHFYLGRWLHGLIDFALTSFGIYFLVIEKDLIGWSILAVDYVHTIIITILLLIGAYKDSKGKIITYPGQTLK